MANRAIADPVFELQQVGCQFGTLIALAELSLVIYPGERVALMGASGAGKSTLLSLLNGALVPSAGIVRTWGEVLVKLPARQRRRLQRRLGTVYQGHDLVTNLAVIHNVNAGHLGRWHWWRAVWSLVWPQELAVAQKALQQVGLPEKLYARTDRLSGGQQQRVAIARVLVQNPEVILADEPVSSVDPERSREIMELLCGLSGKTLVVSLHDIDIARRYCDRMIGLRAGKLLFDAPTAEVSAAMVEALYRL